MYSRSNSRNGTHDLIYVKPHSRSNSQSDSRQRTPKGGGEQKAGGGGAKPHEETPHRKQPTPLTSVCFGPPPPPIPFLLESPLEIPRISLRWPPQKPFSEGLQKWLSRGHREVLIFGTFCPPPFSSAQSRNWLDAQI